MGSVSAASGAGLKWRGFGAQHLCAQRHGHKTAARGAAFLCFGQTALRTREQRDRSAGLTRAQQGCGQSLCQRLRVAAQRQ